MKKLKNYLSGTAEYVVLHAQKQHKRGRNPSLPFLHEKNPRKALILAHSLAYFPIKDEGYLAGVDLSEYVCSDCGASNCKLWRPYQSFNVTLLCARCAATDQEKSIEDIDARGMRSCEIGGKTDQIGWYVCAIPSEEYTKERKVYWGYTSVPNPGINWWEKLPTLSPLQKINLFFTRKGYYDCVVTIADEISEPYDRKITVDLEPAKKWVKGTLVGPVGSISIEDVSKYNNQNFYYINCQNWMYNKDYPLYMAISKNIANGEIYRTKDLSETLGNSNIMSYLFPKIYSKERELQS